MLYQNEESNIEIERTEIGYELKHVEHRGHRVLIVWKKFSMVLGEWVKIPHTATGEYVRDAQAMLRPNGAIWLKVYHGNAYSDLGFTPTYYVMTAKTPTVFGEPHHNGYPINARVYEYEFNIPRRLVGKKREFLFKDSHPAIRVATGRMDGFTTDEGLYAGILVGDGGVKSMPRRRTITVATY